MNDAVRNRYEQLAAAGRIEADDAQRALAERLDDLVARVGEREHAHRPGPLERLIGVRPPATPRGLYIHGAVGRGKTLLMDMFFEAAPVRAKRRVHFHAFMADAHARIHHWRIERKAARAQGDDPIAPVAAELAADAWLLCFDEFNVTDIADAMILGRLFTALFAAGVVVVATSNVAPDDLYKDGLNRALFLPFVALLREKMEVVRLDARTDFRLEKLARAPVYYCPADAQAKAALDRAFANLVGAAHGSPLQLEILGRTLTVPEADDGVARFSFAQLCEAPLGPNDFQAIARRFHTVLVDGVPLLAPERRDVVKRFINLIDTLYDQRVKLIVSADAEPDALYTGESGFEAFEFARTASRLIEMRSADYLALAHGHSGPSASGDLGGLVET
jgi:cell division protein ZapE